MSKASVMICRKIVDDTGKARIVLEPADKQEEREPETIEKEIPVEEDDDEKNSSDDDGKGGRSQKPFISCDKCGKKFFVTDTTYKRTPKERLNLHIITDHNRERLYQCTYEGCFKAYSTFKLLQQHKVTHTSRKRHTCQQCAKQFHRKTHLLAHMRRHAANPNFKPRASRRHFNPYIQVQHKKNGDSEEWNGTSSSTGAEAMITEEELEEMHRVEAEMAEREIMRAFSQDGAEDDDCDDEDEEIYQFVVEDVD